MTIAEQLGARGLEKGMQQGMHQGMQEGCEQGELKVKNQIAKKLLQNGMSIEKVQIITDLSIGILQLLAANYFHMELPWIWKGSPHI